MPLRISFDLGDADLQHFAEVAQHTQAHTRSPEDVIAAASDVLQAAERAQLATFVRERFSRLRILLSMAADPDWPLGVEDSQRLINALACFGGTATQEVTTVGFLDHAIMIELVSRDLEHDLAAYRDFCAFRESQSKRRIRAGEDQAAQREQWLHQRREILQARMHKRRKKALDQAGSSVRKLFSLFGL